MKKFNWFNLVKLAISIVIPLIIGFLGSFFTRSSVSSWYLTIAKPVFQPPSWLFGPVWTFLFILIGISFYLIWINKYKNKNLAYIIYSIQLFLNFLWSLLFFGLRNPLYALIEIFVLWAIILTNIIVFYKISKASAFLLIPYLLWVTFATILNFAIVLLN